MPEFPLVAIVFADQASYARFAHTELGDSASSIIGYYSLATNRMTMYDLTGIESLRRGRSARFARANQSHARPAPMPSAPWPP